MKITFDSNVWRMVVSPAKFPKNELRDVYIALYTSIAEGRNLGFLSETIFRVEGIQNSARRDFLANYSTKPEKLVQELPGNVVHVRLSFGPSTTNMVEGSDYHRLHLADARNLGVKLLHCPRLGNQQNPDVLDSDYVAQSSEDLESVSRIFSIVVQEIENLGCGMRWLTDIGEKYADHWRDGLRSAPQSEAIDIAKAVAEWADADSLAAHIAYGNDVFCTLDVGKSAGSKSILSKSNLDSLKSRYGLRVHGPKEIAP